MNRVFALLFALAIAPAQAAEPWERFFELSFGDLRAEAAEAKKSGQQGLLLMYHFDDCPARARSVRATPTFQFYSPDGVLRVTHVGAIYDPAEFMLLGEYVAGGDYADTSFAVYRQSRQKRGS